MIANAANLSRANAQEISLADHAALEPRPLFISQTRPNEKGEYEKHWLYDDRRFVTKHNLFV